jgi:hypothetical protein
MELGTITFASIPRTELIKDQYYIQTTHLTSTNVCEVPVPTLLVCHHSRLFGSILGVNLVFLKKIRKLICRQSSNIPKESLTSTIVNKEYQIMKE